MSIKSNIVLSMNLRSRVYCGKSYQDAPEKEGAYTGNSGNGSWDNTADAQQI